MRHIDVPRHEVFMTPLRVLLLAFLASVAMACSSDPTGLVDGAWQEWIIVTEDGSGNPVLTSDQGVLTLTLETVNAAGDTWVDDISMAVTDP